MAEALGGPPSGRRGGGALARAVGYKGGVHQLSPGDEVAGYRIESVAGRGGMGVVYRATQLSLDRVVALKQIAPELANDAEFRGRFQRESRIAASLEHPHVVPVYEAEEADGLLFITMRFIEGSDLYGLIRDLGRVEPRRAAAIVAQAASALDAAHERGLVHRDVKPANLLLAEEDGRDHTYLTDFGLTKQASAVSGPTRTGMMVGTVDYMAPEQIEGRRLDARADVYALGCVLYEAVSGRVPFEKDSDMAKLFAHVNADPPSLREVDDSLPEELDAVIRRSLEKDPDARFLSAGDFGRAAVAAAEGRETSSRAERSVARGAAAPTEVSSRAEPPAPAPAPPTVKAPREAPAPPPAAPEPTAPKPPRAPGRPRSKVPLIIAGVLGVVIVLAIIGAVAGDGGGGASGDEAEVEEVVTQWFGESGSDKCAVATDALLQSQVNATGAAGRKACEQELAGYEGNETEVTSTEVTGDTATARVSIAGTEGVARLRRVGGEWKIDGVE